MRNSLCRLLVVIALLAGCTKLPPADMSVQPPIVPDDAVIVYVRTGCPYCEQTLDLLLQREVLPEVRNVGQDRQAYQELLAIHREHFPGEPIIVPVLVQHRTYVRGFNPQSILELVNHSQVNQRKDIEFCD
jgi:glutaredoxin